MPKEIRIEVTDEVYDQLQRLAAVDHVEADQYAAQLLTADLQHARFRESAAAFAEQFGPAFAERFGGAAGTTRAA
ncbi:hypothetical protein [Streptomyces sp. A5-4]|uniref:hypothetical protein n=1 Tax=Streptomyces sp. A5-4 TaxID=3384771 RepID=UPI003DA7EEDE